MHVHVSNVHSSLNKHSQGSNVCSTYIYVLFSFEAGIPLIKNKSTLLEKNLHFNQSYSKYLQYQAKVMFDIWLALTLNCNFATLSDKPQSFAI